MKAFTETIKQTKSNEQDPCGPREMLKKKAWGNRRIMDKGAKDKEKTLCPKRQSPSLQGGITWIELKGHDNSKSEGRSGGQRKNGGGLFIER